MKCRDDKNAKPRFWSSILYIIKWFKSIYFFKNIGFRKKNFYRRHFLLITLIFKGIYLLKIDPIFVVSNLYHLKRNYNFLYTWSILGKSLVKNRYCKIFKNNHSYANKCVHGWLYSRKVYHIVYFSSKSVFQCN